MEPIILFRDGQDWQQEQVAAAHHFPIIGTRMRIQPDSLVIPRYSALPFYRELESDVQFVGAKLINSYQQHLYVADLQNWVTDLSDLTPKTWSRTQDLPENTSFVLKGETNSKKQLWQSHMFAKNKKDAIEVESRLYADSLISNQHIYIREFVPLKTYMIGIQGLPITNEYRFFCYRSQILSGGYYWSSHIEEIHDLNISPDPESVPLDFLAEVIGRIQDNINFYVIDVAETASGDWIVIELNDGSMSGLSENDPEQLYKNLRQELDTWNNKVVMSY
jgi:hypothetical protein